MTKNDTKTLLNKAQAVFAQLIKDDDSLTRQQVLDILGDSAGYYSMIVSGLAYIEKVTRKIGRTGGIEFKSGKGRQKELLPGNLRDLQRYFEDQDIEESASNVDDEIGKEDDLYKPLKGYAEKSGLFTVVEVYGSSRGGGGKRTNPDLVAMTYSTSLKYHVGIYPKLTAFEVKYRWPSIVDLQQAAGYLRYFHSSYLCFYDLSYTGKRFDTLTTRLRDDEIWDWSSVYNIGLIVAFAKQKRSANVDFQIIKEAPVVVVEPETVEDGIDTYFSTEARNELLDAVKGQIKEMSFKTHTS